MLYILGAKINDISEKEALKKVLDLMSKNHQHGYIVTSNPEICLRAEQDEKYQDILNHAFLSLPDGVGLKLGAGLLGQRLKNRVPGADFTFSLMKLSAEKGWRVFLFGATEGIAQKCQNILVKRYKKLQIVGVHDGEIPSSKSQAPNKSQIQNSKLINTINQSNADILLVALGAPLQENWIAGNLSHLSSIKLAMGVGGTFDFIAGKVKRAPRAMRQIGIEWLWRLVQEPRRIKRIYNATLKFMMTVLKWRLRMWFVYRPNVVGLIIKRDGSSVGRTSASQAEDRGFESPPSLHSSPRLRTACQVLLVEREDEPGHWQIPQGGVDQKESPEQAIKREMREEIGTDKLKIIARYPSFHKYSWPKQNQLYRGYRGQKQDLFILEFSGEDQDIKLDLEENINFQWLAAEQVLASVHPVRTTQLKKAINLLKKL